MSGRGFTLIELSLSLALLAGLGLLAAPGLGRYLRDCRQAATIHALTHAVHAARAMAAARGEAVELCPTPDGERCLEKLDWSGSLLFRPAGGGPAIRVVTLPADVGRQSVRANRYAMRFQPLARAATTTTVVVCDDRGAGSARAVVVSRSGRPRVTDRDPSGQPLSCP